MPPVGYCEVWIGFKTPGINETMYTHIGYDLDAGPSQAAVDAGFAAVHTSFAAEVSNQYTMEGHFVVYNQGTGNQRIDYSGAAAAGTNAGSALPANCAVLVKKVTALGGRRNRGRMFIPGVPENMVNNWGGLDAAYRTAWQANMTALEMGGTIATAFGFVDKPQLFHETGSLTPTPVEGLVVDGRTATQRRRLRR